MLELRFTVDAKRIAAMRAAIVRECVRLNAGPQHAEEVAFVAERLVGDEIPRPRRPRRNRSGRSKALVIVTVQSDATMLMVRETMPDSAELGESRQGLLRSRTSRWSTMSGSDGRTVWAEIARPPVAPAARLGSGSARV